MGKTTMKIGLERIINASPSVGKAVKYGMIGLSLYAPSLAGAASDDEIKAECGFQEGKAYCKDVLDDYLNDVLVKVVDEFSEAPLGQATVKITEIGDGYIPEKHPRPLNEDFIRKVNKSLKKLCWGAGLNVVGDALVYDFYSVNSGRDIENAGYYVSDEYEFTGDSQSTQFRVYLDPTAAYRLECTRGAPGVLEREWEAEDGTHRSDTRGDNQRYRPAVCQFGGHVKQMDILMSNDRQIKSIVRTTKRGPELKKVF